MELNPLEIVNNVRQRLRECKSLRWFGGSFAFGSLPFLVMHWRGAPCVDRAMSLQGSFASLKLHEDWVLEVSESGVRLLPRKLQAVDRLTGQERFDATQALRSDRDFVTRSHSDLAVVAMWLDEHLHVFGV